MTLWSSFWNIRCSSQARGESRKELKYLSASSSSTFVSRLPEHVFFPDRVRPNADAFERDLFIPTVPLLEQDAVEFALVLFPNFSRISLVISMGSQRIV